MRLDKFVGKASFHLPIHIRRICSYEELFYLLDGSLYSEFKEDMKKYKVRFYTIKDNVLYVDVKER